MFLESCVSLLFVFVFFTETVVNALPINETNGHSPGEIERK